MWINVNMTVSNKWAEAHAPPDVAHTVVHRRYCPRARRLHVCCSVSQSTDGPGCWWRWSRRSWRCPQARRRQCISKSPRCRCRRSWRASIILDAGDLEEVGHLVERGAAGKLDRRDDAGAADAGPRGQGGMLGGREVSAALEEAEDTEAVGPSPRRNLA
jgi:hypothetical protein